LIKISIAGIESIASKPQECAKDWMITVRAVLVTNSYGDRLAVSIIWHQVRPLW